MNPFLNMMNATRIFGAVTLALGTAIFIYGMIVSDYVMITGIGVGTIMGGVFIFLIGMFLIATEEILNKNHK
ncbi:MAG: hypothetical protein WAM95_05180 [Bacillus sp. (in: firmicutes)]